MSPASRISACTSAGERSRPPSHSTIMWRSTIEVIGLGRLRSRCWSTETSREPRRHRRSHAPRGCPGTPRRSSHAGSTSARRRQPELRSSPNRSPGRSCTRSANSCRGEILPPLLEHLGSVDQYSLSLLAALENRRQQGAHPAGDVADRRRAAATDRPARAAATSTAVSSRIAAPNRAPSSGWAAEVIPDRVVECAAVPGGLERRYAAGLPAPHRPVRWRGPPGRRPRRRSSWVVAAQRAAEA